MSSHEIVTGLLVAAGLTAVSSAFVAAEIALVAVRPTEIEDLVQKGRSGARAARLAKGRLDRSLAAIQVAITTIGLLMGWFGEGNLGRALEPVLGSVLSSIVVLGALVGLQVMLGELVPKAIALRHPRTVALVLARPLLVFQVVVGPAIWVLGQGTELVLRLLGIRSADPNARAHSTSELAMLVEDGARAGVLAPEHAFVVRNAVRLSSKTIEDIMLPFSQAQMIDLRWSTDATLDFVADAAHTRLPVYDQVRTNLVGIINVKDLFHLSRLRGIVHVFDVMKPVTYVEPSGRLEQQLGEFRKDRVHLAVVRRGDGPPLGIVTLEDILEEIVGEIEDDAVALPIVSNPPRP